MHGSAGIARPRVTSMHSLRRTDFSSRKKGTSSTPVPAPVIRRRFGPFDLTLSAIVTVFVCGLCLSLAMVPPWQNPDEPQHMAGILTLAYPSQPDAALRVEREIVRSMADADWWRHYGRVTPRPLPERLESVDSAQSRPLAAGIAYYEAMALLVRALPFRGAAARLYLVRTCSAVFGVLALFCCWAAARCCLGPAAATVTTAVLALNPQFAIVATTASPDAMVNLCGAYLWWQTCRLTREPHARGALLRAWAAAACGAMTRRIGLLLLPIAAVVSAVAVTAAFRRSRREGWTMAAGGVAAVAAVGILAFALPGRVVDVAVGAIALTISAPYLDRLTVEFFGQFTGTLLDSAWLNGGWMRLPAPRFWLNLMHALTAVSVLGVLLELRRPSSQRRVLVTALSLVAVPTVAIYAYYFTAMVGPTARYLFPVAGPLTVLFWRGLARWWPETRQQALATCLIGLLALFDAVAWAVVLVPAYL